LDSKQTLDRKGLPQTSLATSESGRCAS